LEIKRIVKAKANRLLIVEDNFDDERLILRALKRMGNDMQICVVRDGEAAIEFLCESVEHDTPLPDLVILDWKLPKIMGREVLRSIRGSNRCRDLVVVGFSSSDGPGDREECRLLDGDGYVTKPIDYEDFLSAVQGIVSSYGPNRERRQTVRRVDLERLVNFGHAPR
jgi:two-component system response regulator